MVNRAGMYVSGRIGSEKITVKVFSWRESSENDITVGRIMSAVYSVAGIADEPFTAGSILLAYTSAINSVMNTSHVVFS